MFLSAGEQPPVNQLCTTRSSSCPGAIGALVSGLASVNSRSAIPHMVDPELRSIPARVLILDETRCSVGVGVEQIIACRRCA